MWCSVRFFFKKDDLQMKWTFWLGYMLALLSWCAKHDRPIISNITLITFKKVYPHMPYISFTHFELWIPLFLLNIFCKNCLPVCLERKSFKKSQSKHHAFIKKTPHVSAHCAYPIITTLFFMIHAARAKMTT